MTRRKGEGPAVQKDRKLAEGIDRLRNGRLAAPWVCREVLGLCVETKWIDIIKAVHQGIHDALRSEREGDQNTCGALIIAAGAILLRSMMK